ncbi:hypothetical protein EGI22_07580 [Lacihabitans sp. LS3-19]|nr:hypothetical protein [Lacihabitans sp. LS3-19]
MYLIKIFKKVNSTLLDKKSKVIFNYFGNNILILYFGYKQCKEESCNAEIIGKWEKKESKRENFIFTFFKNDSIIMEKANSVIRMKYLVSNDKLEFIDKETKVNDFKF